MLGVQSQRKTQSYGQVLKKKRVTSRIKKGM